MTNPLSKREQDKQKLKAAKTYEARTELLRKIGSNYGVSIYPLARHPKDQLKSVFIRQCKIHGKEEVKMQAFMRGNFGCPHCARDKQSMMYAEIRNS